MDCLTRAQSGREGGEENFPFHSRIRSTLFPHTFEFEHMKIESLCSKKTSFNATSLGKMTIFMVFKQIFFWY